LTHLRRIAKVIIPIFLVIAVCALTNETINQHFHKLPSGEIIRHAHPFKKSNTGTPFQNHHHNASELVLLDLISNIVIRIQFFLLILTPLLFLIAITTFPLFVSFRSSDLYFSLNYHAPPEASY
jgi:hypothetical protein